MWSIKSRTGLDEVSSLIWHAQPLRPLIAKISLVGEVCKHQLGKSINWKTWKRTGEDGRWGTGDFWVWVNFGFWIDLGGSFPTEEMDLPF